MTFLLLSFFALSFSALAEHSCPNGFTSDNKAEYCYVNVTRSEKCPFTENLPIWKYLFLEYLNGRYWIVDFAFEHNTYLLKEKGVYFDAPIANVPSVKNDEPTNTAFNISCKLSYETKFCGFRDYTSEDLKVCFYEYRNSFCDAYKKIVQCSWHCYCDSKFGINTFCRSNCTLFSHSSIQNRYKYNFYDKKFIEYGNPSLKLMIQKNNNIVLKVENFLKLKYLQNNQYFTCYSDTIYNYFSAQKIENSSMKTKFSYVQLERGLKYLKYLVLPEKPEIPLTPGKYWCKGFAYPDLEEITSNVINYETNDYEFVLTADLLVTKSIFVNLEEEVYKNLSNDTLLPIDTVIRPVKIKEKNVVTVKIFGKFNAIYSDIISATKFFNEYLNNRVSDILNNKMCLIVKEMYNDSFSLTWNTTDVGSARKNSENCLDENYVPVERKCIIWNGVAKWDDKLSGDCLYYLQDYILFNKTHVTENLENLLDSTLEGNELSENLMEILEKFHDDFGSYDVHLLAQLIDKLSESTSQYDIQILINAVSSIIDLNREVLYVAQSSLRATDLILRNLDKALSLYGNNYVQKEVKAFSKNLNVHLVNVQDQDFSAIAFYEDGSIKAFGNAKDIVQMGDFSFAVILTDKLHNQIMNNTMAFNNSVFALIGFKRDALFNAKKNKNFKVTGWIPNVFVSDLDTSNLDSPLKLLIKPFRNYRYEHICSYWNLDASRGFWAKDNLPDKEGEYYVCSYNHMTNFALMLNLPSDVGLDVVSIIAYTISLLGVLFIFITACLSRNWRETESAKICLSSCTTIVIQVTFLYLAETIDSYDEEELCVLVGACLQYGILAQFCWMLVMGILQYRKFIIVFTKTTESMFIVSSLFCWLTPILPVSATIVFSYKSYIRDQYCYLTGTGLYLGVFLPISLVVFINILVFVRIFYELCTRQQTKMINTTKEYILYVKLSIFLFFVLGLSWVFGLLNGFLQLPLLSYLFCILTAIQGVTLFWYHVMLNAEARYAWKKILVQLSLSQDGSNLIDKTSTNTIDKH